MDFHDALAYAKEQNRLLTKRYGLEEDRMRILAQTVKLSEEVGELANEVLASQGLQRHEKLAATEKGNVAKEMADVVFVTMLLADTFGVDLEEALSEKIETIKIRRA